MLHFTGPFDMVNDGIVLVAEALGWNPWSPQNVRKIGAMSSSSKALRAGTPNWVPLCLLCLVVVLLCHPLQRILFAATFF